MESYPIAFVPDVDCHEPHHLRQEWLPFDEIAALLTRHERRPHKRGPCFIPAFFPPGSRVTKENAKQLGLLVFDFEKGPLPSDFLESWDEYAFLIYSSHNCSEADLRWRAVFPLTQLMDGSTWERFYRDALAHLTGGRADPVCCNPDRLWFLPSAPRDAPVFARYHEGRLLNPGDIPERKEKPAPEPRLRAATISPPGKGDYSTLDVVAWFQAHGHYGRRLEGKKHAVLCPWETEHTQPRGPEASDSIVWEADGKIWPQFHCAHAHCQGRQLFEVMALWGDYDRYCAREFVPYPPILPRPEDAPREDERPDLRDIPEDEAPAAGETVCVSEEASDTESWPEGSPEAVLASLPHTNAAELREREIAPLVWAIEGLVPEGVTLLLGDSKAGKTFIEVDMSGGISAGGLVLSHFHVAGGPVLIIAMEDGERRMKSRLAALFEGEPAWPEHLHLYFDWPTMNAFGVQVLEAFLARHPGTRLVVLDTWHSLRPAYTKNGDLVKEDYDNIRRLNKLALAHHCGVLVVHHMSKGAMHDFVNAGSGSHGLPAAAEAILAWKRERNSNQGTLSVTGKDVEESEWVLVRNERNPFFAIVPNDEQKALSEARTAVISFLRDAGSASCRRIADGIGRNEKALWPLLQKMHQAALIIKTGTEYGLPR